MGKVDILKRIARLEQRAPALQAEAMTTFELYRHLAFLTHDDHPDTQAREIILSHLAPFPELMADILKAHDSVPRSSFGPAAAQPPMQFYEVPESDDIDIDTYH